MTACPDPVRLVAASAGEDVVALAHAAGCPHCRRHMRDHLAVRELAHDLPAPALTRSRRDSLSAEVLARAELLVMQRRLPPAVIVEPRPIGRVVATVGIAVATLAAAAAAIAYLEPSPAAPAAVPGIASVELPDAPVSSIAYDPAPPELGATSASAVHGRPHTASVTAAAGARFDRHDDGSTDRIALREGTLTIEASAATAPIVVSGKNVRVRTSGARLAAHAAGGVVTQVQVFAGSVEIHTGTGVVVVTAGESWSWDDEAVATARVAAFRAGWDALHAGDFAGAAALLDRAADDPGVGEDATYWAAIAWGRAGDAARARTGLAGFLARFPHATRAGEAHLALARLLDDPDAARAQLEAAAGDPDPRVRAAAKAALRDDGH